MTLHFHAVHSIHRFMWLLVILVSGVLPTSREIQFYLRPLSDSSAAQVILWAAKINAFEPVD